MHRNAEKVQKVLTELGAESPVIELSDSARTVAEAAAALGTRQAQIAKSLLFLTEAGPAMAVLVVASGTNRVSTGKLERRLGRPVTRADADAVRRVTGFPIGGVPPVGHLEPVTIVLDEDLYKYPEVWAAAGTPHAVFRTTAEELARMTGGEVADIREEQSP